MKPLLDMDGIAIVRSRKDFEKVWYYKTLPDEGDYPLVYPCLVEVIHRCGGLGGGYAEHHIVPLPKKIDIQSFLSGYKKGREVKNMH